jgi:phosphatidylinositol alpha-mannosyltransferase
VKIGLVCPYSWDVPGGVRTHVADLASALRDRGHEVSVLAPFDEAPGSAAGALPGTVSDDEDALDGVVDGGRPVAVPYNGSVARLSFGVKPTRRIHRWIKEGAFDVVHVHEPVAPSLSLLTLWIGRGPMVATWHSSQERSRILNAGYYIAQTAMEKLSGRIAVSEDARRTLVAHLGGDAVLIPNGVRVSQYVGVDRLPGVPVDRPTVLFLGRMDEPRKGLKVLWEALPAVLEQVPDLHLLVAGPGDIDEQRALVPPGAEGAVTFLGRISDADKARALRSADVYVAPHTGGESFGIVLVEAMAAGAAVIAADLPAFRRVLEDGRSGLLFRNRDASDLAAGLVRLLKDPDLRAGYVAEANRRVRDFDWDRVVDDVIAVYDSVRVPGETVTVDLRGQLVGRLSGVRGES